MNIDRTISFRQDMIDLILDGKKTLTIRPIKPQPELIKVSSKYNVRSFWEWGGKNLSQKGKDEWFLKQYLHGRIGDTMTIRERPEVKLKITGVTVDWLHEISRDTWGKDGVSRHYVMGGPDLSFYHWQSFYAGAEYEWQRNPWVWVVEFELVKERESNENKRLFETA